MLAVHITNVNACRYSYGFNIHHVTPMESVSTSHVLLLNKIKHAQVFYTNPSGWYASSVPGWHLYLWLECEHDIITRDVNSLSWAKLGEISILHCDTVDEVSKVKPNLNCHNNIPISMPNFLFLFHPDIQMIQIQIQIQNIFIEHST